MSSTVQEPKVLTNDEAILGFVDCDVHPYTKTPADLDEFLPERLKLARDLNQRLGMFSRMAQVDDVFVNQQISSPARLDCVEQLAIFRVVDALFVLRAQ